MGRRLLRVLGGLGIGVALLMESVGCVQFALSDALDYGHSPTLAQYAFAFALPLFAEAAGWICLRRMGRRDLALGVAIVTMLATLLVSCVLILLFAVPFH